MDNIKGTGLGMVIVKSSVETLKGAIDFESTPIREKGTRFIVRLPSPLDRIRPSDLELTRPV